MPIFIVSGDMTQEYHPWASAVVEAVSREAAIEKVALRALERAEDSWGYSESDRAEMLEQLAERRKEWEVRLWDGSTVEIFPNAGCC